MTRFGVGPRGFVLIERNFSIKLKIYRHFTVSFHSQPQYIRRPAGQVVEGVDMTTARRICVKITGGSNLGLLAGLVLVVLPLICCGQNSNNNLKSINKPTGPDIDGGNHVATFRPRAQGSQIVPDEVMVKFNPDTAPEAIAAIQAELQLKTIHRFRSPNLFLMKITDGTAVEAIIRKLKTYPAVEYAEPNYAVKANP